MLRASKPPRPFYAERRQITYTIGAMAAIGLPKRRKVTRPICRNLISSPGLAFALSSAEQITSKLAVLRLEMWDKADKGLIPKIFHPDFTFRGSLGPLLRRHEEFAGYVDVVTSALSQHTSDILGMVEEGNEACAKLRYHEYHRAELLGYQPTGRHVWWYGTPFFTFDADKVRDLWVLGGVHGLIERFK